MAPQDFSKKDDEMIKLDKILHFAAGFLISLVLSILFAPVVGLVSAFGAGIAKELFDLYVRHTFFSWPDMVATCIGGLVCFFIDFLG